MRQIGPVPNGLAVLDPPKPGGKPMEAKALVPCPDCGHQVSRLADACPSCARPLRPAAPREGLFLRTMNELVAAGLLLALFLLVVLLGAGLLAYLLGYFDPSVLLN